jgi:hypothetical protein
MHAPYQTVGELSYHIRAGSNFVRAPHAVLAGMFGRRPQPVIKQSYFVTDRPTASRGVVKTQVGVILKNYGRGIAESVFLNLKLTSHPGRMCQIKFVPPQEQEVWWGRFALAQEMHVVTRAGYPLPPDAYLMSVSIDIILQNPLERDFAFGGTCGCAGGETSRFEFRSRLINIVNAFDRLSKTPEDAVDLEVAMRRFNSLFFEGIETE